jgi:hypothetical protein
VFQDVKRIFCVDFNSEKSDPKFPSGRSNHASRRLSLSKSRIVQGCIYPDVMATRPNTLKSSISFHLSFVDTNGKLNAYTLHLSGQQGNTVRTRSYYGHYIQTNCNCLDSRATPSEHGLNMKKRGVRYGKPVAQNTFWTLNASVRALPREIRDRIDLGLFSL